MLTHTHTHTHMVDNIQDRMVKYFFVAHTHTHTHLPFIRTYECVVRVEMNKCFVRVGCEVLMICYMRTDQNE